MLRKVIALGFIVFSFVLLSGCTVMEFSGKGSTAASLEMSNVNNIKGEIVQVDNTGHRGFFLIMGLIPLSVPTIANAVGPEKSAVGIEVTTEQDIIDLILPSAQSLIGMPALLSSRSVTVYAEVE